MRIRCLCSGCVACSGFSGLGVRCNRAWLLDWRDVWDDWLLRVLRPLVRCGAALAMSSGEIMGMAWASPLKSGKKIGGDVVSHT